MAFGQCVLGKIPPIVRPRGNLEVIDGGWNIGVVGENFRLLFSKSQCGLVSYQYGGRELLKSIPRPNFWRAPTDNDRGGLPPGPLRPVEGGQPLRHRKPMPYSVPDMKNENSCAMERGDGWVRVTFRYLLPTQPRTACALSYRVFATVRWRPSWTATPGRC